jgi:CRISPR-associated RAMP protein (TIGR02581 family)
MFKTIRNFHIFHLKVTPKSGFHIGSGDTDISPVATDAQFVRLNTPWGRTVYIPGSSLKGVFRADAEAFLKSMEKEACEFTVDTNKDCGGKREINNFQKSEEIYPKVCHACKMFGNMKMASVVRFEDFFPFESDHSEDEKAKKIQEIEKYTFVRNGIKIDRLSGSTVKGALYDFEVLNGGNFYGNVLLKNPEIWQVLMIYKTINNINDGFVKVGGKKSRGLGKLDVEIKSLEIYSTNKNAITFTTFENGRFMNKNVEFNFQNAEKEEDLIGLKIKITNKDEIKSYFDQVLTKLPESW